MKILVLNWQDIKSPLGGGAEVHLHEIFKRIAANGHEVTLFCYRYKGALSEEIVDGIRVIRKGSRSFFNFYVPIMYLKNFHKGEYDIIIDDINKIPFYTPIYVRKPLLAISHHFFGTSIFRESGFIAGCYVYMAEKVVDWIYKKTPFVVVSQSTLQEFIDRGFNPEMFSIVPNAISQNLFPMKVNQKNEFPTITYFGRLKKYKSVDHLLRAFALVSKKLNNAKLLILGKGDYQPKLEELAKELGISDNTTFSGFISEEDKIPLLSLSHCVVNTSMKEGWGITNIEANACGTLVISANVPGLRDSVKEGVSGLLYEYGNIEQLADILIEILTNTKLREKLSEGAVTWAKSFSWDKSAELMINRCEEILRRKTP